MRRKIELDYDSSREDGQIRLRAFIPPELGEEGKTVSHTKENAMKDMYEDLFLLGGAVGANIRLLHEEKFIERSEALRSIIIQIAQNAGIQIVPLTPPTHTMAAQTHEPEEAVLPEPPTKKRCVLQCGTCGDIFETETDNMGKKHLGCDGILRDLYTI